MYRVNLSFKSILLLSILNPFLLFSYETDSCLYGEGEGLACIDELLEESIKRTVDSPQWKEKIAQRRKDKALATAKWVTAPLGLLATGVVLQNPDMISAGCTALGVILFPAWVHYWHISENGRRQDVCELEIQKMYDLKSAKISIYSTRAEKVLSYLESRKNEPASTGEDVAKYYAAKIGWNIAELDPTRREKFAKGPKKRWEDYDNRNMYAQYFDEQAKKKLRENDKMDR